mmetsp:Transcript_36320/g.73884  ORF Transcript_36320/g.73884 Transcript_36320/m.73884 type:complete len:311 (+) Transcript_36320:4297-5229(+)
MTRTGRRVHSGQSSQFETSTTRRRQLSRLRVLRLILVLRMSRPRILLMLVLNTNAGSDAMQAMQDATKGVDGNQLTDEFIDRMLKPALKKEMRRRGQSIYQANSGGLGKRELGRDAMRAALKQSIARGDAIVDANADDATLAGFAAGAKWRQLQPSSNAVNEPELFTGFRPPTVPEEEWSGCPAPKHDFAETFPSPTFTGKVTHRVKRNRDRGHSCTRRRSWPHSNPKPVPKDKKTNACCALHRFLTGQKYKSGVAICKDCNVSLCISCWEAFHEEEDLHDNVDLVTTLPVTDAKLARAKKIEVSNVVGV